MSIIAALLIALVAYAAYRLAQDYVRRSMRSFGHADRVGALMKNAAADLLDEDIPLSVARAAVGLVYVAGCGCFVRGILVNHYLPRFRGAPPSPAVEQTFDDLDVLNAEQRAKFWALLAAVIAYDSFRNPLQGWLFRRIAKEYFTGEPKMGASAKLDAAVTAFSVLSRKAAHA